MGLDDRLRIGQNHFLTVATHSCDTGELRLSFAFIPIDLRRLMHKVHKIRRNVRLGLPAVADSETASSYSETEFESEMAALGEGGQLATEPSAADVTGEDDNPILHVTLAAARSLPSSIDAYVVVFVSEQREDESEDELVFRTKAAIRDPDPEFNDRFDLVIDEGMPKDARLVFEIRDRQTFVSPDEDPVVGRATVKLTSLKMNVKKEAWLSIHSSEGVFGLDRDAGVKVDLLLRPDDRVGDYVEEGPKDKEKFHLLGLESGEPSKEKRAMYEEKGGHGVQAGIKTLGRKVKKTAKDLATTPLNIISRSKPPFPPPPEHPNPDFSDPTAAPGSLLVRGAPSSVGRVKAAVTKSGIGAELAYWAHYLARGIVLPRHMRSGTVVLQCVSLGSLDRGVNVDQGGLRRTWQHCLKQQPDITVFNPQKSSSPANHTHIHPPASRSTHHSNPAFLSPSPSQPPNPPKSASPSNQAPASSAPNPAS